LPDATDLKIYIGRLSSVSRGTAKTMVEGIADAVRLRRNAKVILLSRPNSGLRFLGRDEADDQVSRGDVATYESDVFEKSDGQWLLVSHLALRVPK
jgi:hypothetical protein